MPVPMICEELNKPVVKHERVTARKTGQQDNVRPQVAKLISKVIKENAPTWKALAKR
jgi:hypothetical protein